MTTTTTRPTFETVTSEHSVGYNAPQKMGRRLWAPMWALGLMGWAVGFVLAIVRANEISSGGSEATIARLSHVVPAFMFLGFLGVLTAVSFAIARILGAFRKGGGDVQETVGPVETLRMPKTAKAFMALMMMGMMVLAVTVIIHLVVAANVTDSNLVSTEQWAIGLEGFRRLGVAIYLFAITLGLGTIIHVLRFQSIRVRELRRS